LPIYRDIQAELLRRISTGIWPTGTTIPHETALAAEFDCTRTTIGRALRELASAGLIERKRKAGTKVIARSGRDAIVTISPVREEVRAAGQDYGYALVARDQGKAPEAVRAAMGLSARDTVLHVQCLHFADGQPHQFEDRWINLATVPAAKGQSFEEISPNEWLIREVPYSRARHVFRAARPAEQERNTLRLAPDEWVFVVERVTWLEASAITYARLLHPADRFQLITRDPEAMRQSPPPSAE